MYMKIFLKDFSQPSFPRYVIPNSVLPSDTTKTLARRCRKIGWLENTFVQTKVEPQTVA